MKKGILLILLISVFAVGYGQRFYGGLYGGLSGCGVGGNQYRGLNKLGFSAGMFTYIQFTDYHGLQLELGYAMKGDHHNPSNKDADPHTYNLNLSFIEIPLLYKLSLNKWFDIKAGLSYNALIGHKEVMNGQDIGNNPGSDIQANEWHRSSMSFVGALSFNILPKLFVDVRTSIGLTSYRGSTPNFGYFVQRFGWGEFADTFVVTVGYKLFGKSEKRDGRVKQPKPQRALPTQEEPVNKEVKDKKIKLIIGGKEVN